MKNERQQLGSRGEATTAKYLRSNGYVIREQNYTCRYGEVDLIAQKGETIAFVEVKLRNTEYFFMSDLITPAKQRKIIAAACHYLRQNSLSPQEKALRFDVAFVTPIKGEFSLSYRQNAFTQHC